MKSLIHFLWAGTLIPMTLWGGDEPHSPWFAVPWGCVVSTQMTENILPHRRFDELRGMTTSPYDGPLRWLPREQVWVVDTAMAYSTTDTSRHTYLFNGSALMTQDLCERWVSNQWTNSSRQTCTYDSVGRILVQMLEYWSSGWGFYSHRIYSYDAGGRLLTLLTDVWLGTYMDSHRTTYTYDSSGRTLSFLIEHRITGEWVNYQRSTFTYDSSGTTSSQLWERWSTTQWVNSDRYTSTFNANQDLISELYERWLNNQWENSQLLTLTYDSNRRWIEQLGEAWVSSQWVNNFPFTYTYGANGEMESILDEDWSNNQWVNNNRYTYGYDANINATSVRLEGWQDSVWMPRNGATSLLDKKGNRYDYTSFHRVTLHYQLVTTDIREKSDRVPLAFHLLQNYPNPFNPTTKIRFDLPRQSHVRLTVYDLLGREVTTLVDGVISAGVHEATLSTANLASGVYFYCLNADRFVQTRKMVLQK